MPVGYCALRFWSQQAYVKSSNTEIVDNFGVDLALSSDGNTLAVSSDLEDSSATGINGEQANNSAADSGAVYMFMRVSGIWSQQAYLKATNTGVGDNFGINPAISDDGNTLALGAPGEDSVATGVGGDQTDNTGSNVGAVYLY